LPGSTIGNFDFLFAKDFLTRIKNQLGVGSHLLIGYDLVKAEETLLAAYNDAKGVTARFNLNLLNRINRELKADFDLRLFKHESRFNQKESRVEMHLISLAEQEVTIADETISFLKGESIHTENSHKYTPELFHELIKETGWYEEKTWSDDKGFYAVSVLTGE